MGRCLGRTGTGQGSPRGTPVGEVGHEAILGFPPAIRVGWHVQWRTGFYEISHSESNKKISCSSALCLWLITMKTKK